MHTPNHQPLAIEAEPQRLMIEAPKPGTDLVPTTYQRQVWNADHGMELHHHDDLLDAEQAKRINDHFSIEIFAGTHGQALPRPDFNNPAEVRRYHRTKPTQKEYAAASALVDSLRPGDTLFVEGIGFTHPIVEGLPQVFLEMANPPVSDPSNPFAAMDHWGKDIAQAEIARLRKELEDKRANYEIHAWDYASQLARLKGITVVSADIDAFEEQRFARDGKNQSELLRSADPEEAAYAQRVQAVRENRARNIVKDWALDHLPPESTPLPAEGEKPRLVLAFGSDHKGDLNTKFEEIGLPVTIHEMEATTSIKERMDEQRDHVLGKAMLDLAQTMSAMAVASSQATIGDAPRPSTEDALRKYRKERFKNW